MIKDNTISFRASKELHLSLARAAKEERRSVSSLIEMTLTNYLKGKTVLRGAQAERRQYRRRTLSVPTVINQQELGQMAVGAVSDISLNGVGIVIARDSKYRVSVGSEGSTFELVFNLPSDTRMIRICCESKRVVEVSDGIQVGASFVDADFKAYQALQAYLM